MNPVDRMKELAESLAEREAVRAEANSCLGPDGPLTTATTSPFPVSPPKPPIPENGNGKRGGGDGCADPVPLSRQVVSFDDLKKLDVRLDWLWPGWLLRGALGILAARGGQGKTRVCADLVRRIRLGLPWPDGAPMTAPADLPVLWLPGDCHYAELTNLHDQFNLGAQTYLAAWRSDPFQGLNLDNKKDMDRLADLVRACGAGLVLIDTLAGCSSANLNQQHETTRLLAPLARLAAATRACILLLYHNNKSDGRPLGERVVERCRTVVSIGNDAPPIMRVMKTFSMKPGPLKVLMGDSAIAYDPAPEAAEASASSTPGSPCDGPTPVERAAVWLRAIFEASAGPVPLSTIRGKDDARIKAAGFAYDPTIKQACNRLGVVWNKSPSGRWLLALPGACHSPF